MIPPGAAQNCRMILHNLSFFDFFDCKFDELADGVTQLLKYVLRHLEVAIFRANVVQSLIIP